jgi:GntR family transcriptional regulator
MQLTPVGHTVDIASPVEEERLRLSSGEKVLRLERLRYAGGQSRMFERSVLPLQRLPGVHIDHAQHLSLAEIAEQFGLELGKATERLSITHATPAIAFGLAVSPTQRLLQIDRVTSTVDDVPIEWRVVFVMEMSS